MPHNPPLCPTCHQPLHPPKTSPPLRLSYTIPTVFPQEYPPPSLANEPSAPTPPRRSSTLRTLRRTARRLKQRAQQPYRSFSQTTSRWVEAARRRMQAWRRRVARSLPVSTVLGNENEEGVSPGEAGRQKCWEEWPEGGAFWTMGAADAVVYVTGDPRRIGLSTLKVVNGSPTSSSSGGSVGGGGCGGGGTAVRDGNGGGEPASNGRQKGGPSSKVPSPVASSSSSEPVVGDAVEVVCRHCHGSQIWVRRRASSENADNPLPALPAEEPRPELTTHGIGVLEIPDAETFLLGRGFSRRSYITRIPSSATKSLIPRPLFSTPAPPPAPSPPPSHMQLTPPPLRLTPTPSNYTDITTLRHILRRLALRHSTTLPHITTPREPPSLPPLPLDPAAALALLEPRHEVVHIDTQVRDGTVAALERAATVVRGADAEEGGGEEGEEEGEVRRQDRKRMMFWGWS